MIPQRDEYPEIPDILVKTIQNNPAAAKWLKKLPELISYCIKRWNLTHTMPAQNMSYNYILFAKQGNKDIVLKLCWDKPTFQREFYALQAYKSSNACVAVLDRCLMRKALLLERIHPGLPLSELFPTHEQKCHEVFCNILPKLQAGSFDDKHFKPVETVLEKLFTHDYGFMSDAELDHIRNTATYLLQTTTHKVLLHGDLHHDNIISSGDSWLAIDPQGFIGDPNYDTGPFMRNPIEKVSDYDVFKETLSARADYLSKALGFDKKRIFAWSFVQAGLAACWDFEDHGKPDRWLPVFKVLSSCYEEI